MRKREMYLLFSYRLYWVLQKKLTQRCDKVISNCIWIAENACCTTSRHRNAAFRVHPSNFTSRSASRPQWHQNVIEQSLWPIFPATRTRISATCSHDLAVWQVNGSATRNSMSLFNFLRLARRPQRNFASPTKCRWLQRTNGTKSRSCDQNSTTRFPISVNDQSRLCNTLLKGVSI